MSKRIAIIGAGFSGLSAAAYAAQAGHCVDVFEKNSQPGGRARQFETSSGYKFDMGPSWYWMPDIIDDFFKDFDCRRRDFFELISLNPQFEVLFKNDKICVPSSMRAMIKMFESIETGAGKQLEKFMSSARFKYEIGMREFVTKPCHSWREFTSLKLMKTAFKLDLLTNFRRYVQRYFSDPKLQSLMEFPVIFLGSSPKRIPALYSLMNYGGFGQGTFYPQGGFYQLVTAMKTVGEQQGANFYFNRPVEKIKARHGRVQSLIINGELHDYDAVIASSDYHHSETLLADLQKNYDESYWEERTMAPSCLIYYLGISERLLNLKHHTLFFEHALDDHLNAVYNLKSWPEHPLFYACCPSKTDASVAPEGCENLFLLMPIPTNANDQKCIREKYLEQMLKRLECHTGCKNLSDKIAYKRSYAVSDFKRDYNAYAGNAYGLANTLRQTAFLKPKMKNKINDNLIYTGQLTVPGPGVPPSIISGKIAAQQLSQLKALAV